MPRRLLTALLFTLSALALLALSACGESKEEKALAAVCSAKGDIAKQVEDLSKLTLETVTVDKVRGGISSIRADLKTIADNTPTLAEDVKPQVESANTRFKVQLGLIAATVGRSLTVGDAKQLLESAVKELASGYAQTFESLDCDNVK